MARKKKTYPCPGCGKVYKRKGDLTKHKRKCEAASGAAEPAEGRNGAARGFTPTATAEPVAEVKTATTRETASGRPATPAADGKLVWQQWNGRYEAESHKVPGRTYIVTHADGQFIPTYTGQKASCPLRGMAVGLAGLARAACAAIERDAEA